ncbi:MAG: hypothetical protein ACP5JF_08495 [Candidatus Methanodesulfokora sp.]
MRSKTLLLFIFIFTFIFVFLPILLTSGWSAEIYWHMDKQVYSPGDTANITLELRNTGKEAISVLYVKLSPDWGSHVERSVKAEIKPGESSEISSFQLKIPENVSSGWHTVMILLRMRTTSEFSWEVPMPINIAKKDVELNCSSFEDFISCTISNTGATLISGELIFHEGNKMFNITLNPGESRSIIFGPAEGNITILFRGDGIEKHINMLVSSVKLIFMSYRPIIQGYYENISVAVNCSSRASIFLEVDGRQVDKADVEKGVSTATLRWMADESGEHTALIRICSARCVEHKLNITVVSREELEKLLVLLKGIKEMEKLGGKSYLCEKAEEDLMLLNKTGDPYLINTTKKEMEECFLLLKSSICNSLGNKTDDPNARRIIEMARNSSSPEDFMKNISSVKIRRRMPTEYLLLSAAAALSITIFLALRERRKGFKRRYKGFKYRK